MFCQQNGNDSIKILEDSLKSKELIFFRYLPSKNCCDHGPPTVMIFKDSDFDLVLKLQEMDIIHKLNPYYKVNDINFSRLKFTLMNTILPKNEQKIDINSDELHIYIYENGKIIFKYEIEDFRFQIQFREILENVLSKSEQAGIIEKLMK
jgi:hypothetical protein